MTFRLILTATARQDISQLRRYIRKASSPAIAARFIEDLAAYTANLQTFPLRGMSRHEVQAGLRVIGFRGRVSIHYLVAEDVVTILAYTYAGRNWSDDYAE